MKLADLPPAVLELLCAHEVFRRLGFEADQLDPVMGRDAAAGGTWTLFMELRTDPPFKLGICRRFCSDTELLAWWRLGIELWNTGATAAEVQAVWERSLTKPRMQDITFALLGKGITPPAIAARIAEQGGSQ